MKRPAFHVIDSEFILERLGGIPRFCATVAPGLASVKKRNAVEKLKILD
jgi:hypothetical protein